LSNPIVSNWSAEVVAELLPRLSSARGTTVTIPVHNGGARVVERCITSVLEHSGGARVVVIDDATSDAKVLDVLAGFSDAGAIELHRHETNWGYTRTANHAFALGGDDDVVLLNSDTVVGPGWLRRMRWTAYSRANVGTVSAVSDNAGAMAVPTPGTFNEWPEHLTWAEISRGVAKRVNVASMVLPSGHGFCMFVRRDLINAIGDFDEVAFPQGYGEENDFCQRAIKSGFLNLLAPHVMVGHARSQSFGEERRAALVQVGRDAVDAMHPEYTAEIRAWNSSEEMAQIRADFTSHREALARESAVKPVLLYVIHRSGGGTPATNKDLLSQLVDVQDSLLLEATASAITLYEFTDGVFHRLETWKPTPKFDVTDTWRDDYAQYVAELILRHNIELVHIRHLVNQPLTTIPEVCRLMGVPMILSTHDFYYICPTIHLLDESLKYCGGVCTPGEGACTLPTAFVKNVPTLKHDWVHEWRRRASGVLDSASAVIATTPSAASIYADNYPAHQGKLELIEHGRDVSAIGFLREADRLPGPMRIMLPANWAPQKGIDLIQELVRRTSPHVEWHGFGKNSRSLGDLVIGHGEFTRANYASLAREVDPDFIGIFSVWPETYSHTVTEAWAFGVPVLSTDIGAPADRIRLHGGGQVVSLDPDVAVQQILALATAPEEWPVFRAAVPRDAIRSDVTMGQDYAMLYSKHMHGTELPPVVGVLNSAPADSAARSEGRSLQSLLGNIHLSRLGVVRRLVVNDLISGADATDYASLVVTASALDSETAGRVLELSKMSGRRLVFDLDDDRLAADGGGHLDSHVVVALLQACDLVVARSASLANFAEPFANNLVSFDYLADPRKRFDREYLQVWLQRIAGLEDNQLPDARNNEAVVVAGIDQM